METPREGEDQAIPSQGRSYDCAFCKRGFSNAQALGGHMNLHRKDRAKLKQPASSSDHRKNIASDQVGHHLTNPNCANFEMGMEPRHHQKRRSFPWLLYHGDHQILEKKSSREACPRQLRLFDDSPLMNANMSLTDRQRPAMETRMHLACHEADVEVDPGEEEEVDLELRLGPEP